MKHRPNVTSRLATPTPAAEDPPATAALARWGTWIVLAAALLAHGPVLFNDFGPLDDLKTIITNQRLAPPPWRADGVGWFWRHPYMSLYTPVTYTAWGLLAAATWVPTPDEYGAHVDARVFHAASLTVHALAALGVLALLRRLLRPQWSRAVDVAAVIGAALFAVHPVQVEPVAWASGMKDLLCGCFSLWALYCYVRSAQATNSSRPPREPSGSAAGPATLQQAPPGAERPWPWYVCGLLLLVGALLSKATAMTTPLTAAALDLLILRRPARTVLRSIAPWFVIAAPMAVVAKLVQPAVEAPLPSLPLRPGVAAGVIAFYLLKILWPATLTIDYGIQAAALARDPLSWVALVAIIAVGVWIIGARRRRPWLAAAACAFFLPLLPVLGFTRFEYMYYSVVADHYLYLPMLGVAIAVTGIAAMTLQSHPRRAPALFAIAGLLLLALAARSAVQAAAWRNPGTLGQAMVRANPRSMMGQNAVALAFERQGDIPAAIDAYRRAADAYPPHPVPHENLSRLYLRQGRANDAITEIRKAIDLSTHLTLDPVDRRVSLDVAAGLEAIQQRRYADAVTAFRDWASAKPDDPDAAQALKAAEAGLQMNQSPTSRPATTRP